MKNPATEKTRIFAGVLALLFAGACAPRLRVQPAAQSVKKVMIVNFYMNDIFHDFTSAGRRRKEGAPQDLMSSLKKGMAEDIERVRVRDSLETFAGDAQKTFKQNLESGAAWEVSFLSEVPYEKRQELLAPILLSPDLGAYVKTEAYERQWGALDETIFIPVEMATGRGGGKNGLNRIKPANVRRDLAALCRRAGVDAAALVRLEFGYMPIKSKASLFDYGAPAVRYEIAVIDDKGKIVLEESPRSQIYVSGQKHLIVNRYMPVTDKNVDAFYALVDVSSRGLAQDITAALQKNSKGKAARGDAH